MITVLIVLHRQILEHCFELEIVGESEDRSGNDKLSVSLFGRSREDIGVRSELWQKYRSLTNHIDSS